MSKVEQAKIAFVYSGLIAPGIKVGDPTPGIAISCKDFPSEQLLSVNFGVIDFNGVDNYSLEIEIFYDGETVSIESDLKEIFQYQPQWGSSGEYVATMSVIQSFIAKGPGYYTLEASLLFKLPTPNSEWEVIDVKKSFFAVSKEWRNKIDG